MRCKIRKIIKITFISILCTSTAAMADTLYDAVQLGLITHPDVLLNTAKTLTTKQGVSVARGGFYPTIDLAAGSGREYSLNPTTQAIQNSSGTANLNRVESSIEIRQKLFAGGAVVNEFKRKKFEYQAQGWKTLGVAEDMALDIVNRYLTVLLHQQLYELAIENYDRHLPIRSMIKARSLSGLARISDVDQADGRLAQAEANRISAEANLREARINYAKAVGKWPDRLQWPKIPHGADLPLTLEQAVEIGLDEHPTLKSAYGDIKEAKAQYSVANSAFFPKVDLVISGSKNRDLDGLQGRNDDAMIMVRGTYNVFRGGSDRAHIRETAYQVQEAYEIKNKSIIDLKESIRLAWNALRSAQARLAPLKLHVTASQKTRLAYQEQFKLNKRTLLDLLDSQNELFQAQNDLARGKMDEIFARFRILNGMGKLMPYLHLKVPENVTNDDIVTSGQKHVLLNVHDTCCLPRPDTSTKELPLGQTIPSFDSVKLNPAIVNNNTIALPKMIPKRWYISTGACKTEAHALALAHRLQGLGFNAHPCLFKGGFDVLIGPYEYKGQAGNSMARMKEALPIPGCLVTYQGIPRLDS